MEHDRCHTWNVTQTNICELGLGPRVKTIHNVQSSQVSAAQQCKNISRLWTSTGCTGQKGVPMKQMELIRTLQIYYVSQDTFVILGCPTMGGAHESWNTTCHEISRTHWDVLLKQWKAVTHTREMLWHMKYTDSSMNTLSCHFESRYSCKLVFTCLETLRWEPLRLNLFFLRLLSLITFFPEFVSQHSFYGKLLSVFWQQLLLSNTKIQQITPILLKTES